MAERGQDAPLPGRRGAAGPVYAALLGLLLLGWLVLVPGCVEPPSMVEAIRAAGELRVVTIDFDARYYAGHHGVVGLEHDLVTAFAEYLGVEPVFVFAENARRAAELVVQRKGHMAAANVAVADPLYRLVEFGPTYLLVTQQVIYRRGETRPLGVGDLVGKKVRVLQAATARALLEDYRRALPRLAWQESAGEEPEEVLGQLVSGAIDLAVMPSHVFAMAQRYYPETGVAFDMGDPEALAWMYSAEVDDSLSSAMADYFRLLHTSGGYNEIWDRYFSHFRGLEYLEARSFMRAYRARLREYAPLFKRAARYFDLDWNLLAALSYQESHWNEHARSPTGVRGLMMLTKSTAEALGVDRLDPAQSVFGGVRYLTRIRARLPQRIAEPDRTWLALAAYNIGLGHLEDARVLTAKRGLDPDRWADVRTNLPLLSRKEWSQKTRHGPARGGESVDFVRNIRRYWNLLRHLEQTGATPRLIPSRAGYADSFAF